MELTASNGKSRKAAIVATFRDCLLSGGYAETSLTDIANGVGMTVSHLLYYYSSKEAILLDLYAEVSGQVLADLEANFHEPVEERIHLLADHMFASRREQSDGRLIRDIIALSNHIPELANRMQEFGDKTTAYLEDLFSNTPRQHGLSALDSAQLASALWMGLSSNAEFDRQLTQNRARHLFRKMLLNLANLRPANQPSTVLTEPENGQSPHS